jgi:hypothetical protein
VMLNTGHGRNRKRLGRKLGNQEIQVRNSFGFSGADGRLHENKSERGEINRVSPDKRASRHCLIS